MPLFLKKYTTSYKSRGRARSPNARIFSASVARMKRSAIRGDLSRLWNKIYINQVLLD